MSLYFFVSLVFLGMALLLVFHFLKFQDIFGSIHVLFFIIFVNILHLNRIIIYGDRYYEIDIYITTNVVIFLYLFLFSLGAFLIARIRFISRKIELLKTLLSIKDIYLIISFLLWILTKIYLVTVYGALSFSHFSQLTGRYNVTIYEYWWEKPLELYSGNFAVAASIIYIINLIFKEKYWKKINVSIPFIVFIIPYIGTHSAIMGPRRFLLIFCLLILLLLAIKNRMTLTSYIRSHWGKALLVLCCLSVSAGYYQTIRNNFFQPEIATKLTSKNPRIFLSGVTMALLPISKDKRVTKKIDFFREGPFEIIYDVIQRRSDGSSGTHGAITKNAFMSVVPRVIAGNNKREINADDILLTYMNIAPAGIYSVTDVATSLLCIFIADFGLLGVLIAPMVILISFSVLLFLLKNKLFQHPLMILQVVSACLLLSANVEGSLTSILANLRNTFILFFALIPLHFVRILYVSTRRRVINY
ncbi:hypothetical protein GKODMF_11695 [Candidatus Electrothrix gigas]